MHRGDRGAGVEAMRSLVGMCQLAFGVLSEADDTRTDVARHVRSVTRLLGARNALQAQLTAGNAPVLHVVGAAMDVAHGASMLVVAVVSRDYRRPAAASSALAVAFAAAEIVAACR